MLRTTYIYRSAASFLFLTSVIGTFFLTNLALAVDDATLFLNPGIGSFLVGSTFDVSIVLDTKGKSVNTIEIDLRFPPNLFQVANPSTGKSIIQLWPTPPQFSNREGRIYFVGGIPGGISTSQGVVLRLTFRAVAPGEGQISFGADTSVLAHDGKGTDILGQKSSAFYSISVPPPLGPSISSPTHPDQEKWYNDPNPILVWPKGRFTNGYSYLLDQNPSTAPDAIIETDNSTALFNNLNSGIWYFHLREQSGGVWGGLSHFVVRIDTEAPADFTIPVSPSRRTRERNPIFRFFTTDALSGLDHFEMKIVPISSGQISESLFFEVSSPYQAPNFDSGRYQVIIRATDKAGNVRDQAVTMTIISALYQFITPEGLDLIALFIPWSVLIDIISVMAMLLGVAAIIVWYRHQHHLKHAFSEDFYSILRKIKEKLHLVLLVGVAV
ncbi:MAG: cohesin domain-containing protein, partial [Patescibacteria group bacterium]